MLKRFEFFSRSLVTADGIALDFRSISTQQEGHPAFTGEDFTCCSAGGGRLVLGDARGGVTVMASNGLRPVRHALLEEPLVLVQMTGDVLVAVSASCQVRLLRLEDDSPALLSRLSPSAAWRKRTPSTPPVCAAVSKDLRNLALGFEDGAVLWFKAKSSDLGEDLAEFDENHFKWLGPFPSGGGGGVTSLGFTPGTNDPYIWVSLNEKLLLLDFQGGEAVLDGEEGCRIGCGVVGPDPNFYVMAKPDRIAFYTTETPGACYSILGGKERMVRCHDNLVVVSLGEVWQGAHHHHHNSTAASSTAAPDVRERKHTVQIMDLQNKFIAHEFPLWRDGWDRCHLLACDEESGCVFILTKDRRRLWKLQEKPIEVKLDELLRRNLFSTAASLAKSSGCEPGYVADIHRRYGDHLFEKGSHDDAVSQYILTIGRVEPSYVIRKFLDAPRIHNLTTYLEALHQVGKQTLPEEEGATATTTTTTGVARPPIPSPEHTTLLLTCYAKLKDEQKIADLLRVQDSKIDVDAALGVLKETGRMVPALELARARGKDEWFVNSLMELATEKAPQHAESALEFLKTNRLVDLFRVHCNKLLKLLPGESVECIKHWMNLKRDRPEESLGGGIHLNSSVLKLEELFDCLADFPTQLEELCAYAIFMEEEQEGEEGGVQTSPMIWNCALELSLANNNNNNGNNTETAWDLLTNPRMDVEPNFALSIVRKFRYRKGELFLHERAQEWDMLLRCKLDDGDDNDAILGLAKTKLEVNTDAWLSVLRYLGRQTPTPERDASIREALRHIEQHDVVPPLLALRVLSESGHAVSLGIVRPYLIGQIERASKQAESDQVEVKQLREDTERMRKEIGELTTKPKVFNATTCCMTGAPLELPVVHFQSGNSYNLSSLPSSSASSSFDRFEDPKCVQDQNSVFDIAKGLAKRRQEVDEEFFSELQMTSGGEAGFSFVADYFGKCLFDDDGNEEEDDDEDLFLEAPDDDVVLVNKATQF